jgi:hypothetical protein
MTADPKKPAALAAEAREMYAKEAHAKMVMAEIMSAMKAERDAAIRQRDQAVEVLRRWELSGCPDCVGDCSSANPPVIGCIMRATRAAIRKEPTDA